MNNTHPVKTLAFLGGGNMAEAFISGLVRAGLSAGFRMRVCDVRAERMSELEEKYGASPASSIAACLDRADLVVLAVKPQDLSGVLGEVGAALSSLRPLPLVVSIAAGVRLECIARRLPEGAPLVRVMPNLPCVVGRGLMGYFVNDAVRPQQIELCLEVLGAVGRAVPIEDEALMDSVTALSGSGPAFVFHFIQGLADGGVRCGLSPDLALELAVETVIGAGLLLEQSGQTPAELIRRVASKGGTTERGLAVLEKHNVAASISETVRAAHERAVEMSRMFS